MDKTRHLIDDKGFDLFERASYGKGCEIQPFIHDHNHGQKCELCGVVEKIFEISNFPSHQLFMIN